MTARNAPAVIGFAWRVIDEGEQTGEIWKSKSAYKVPCAHQL